MLISQRLMELGIELPSVSVPVASYIPAKKVGQLIFTSGQLPLINGVLQGEGQFNFPDEVEEGQKLAQICFLNALAAASELVGIDSLKSVIKMTIFVSSSPSFHSHPLVGNGASDLAKKIFGDEGAHARSAVGVSALPRNAKVEVEVIFEVKE
jgi:enamine deaminase RidA (YjgF/YER057c/UK114 family)